MNIIKVCIVFSALVSICCTAQHHQLIIIGSGPAGLTAGIYAGSQNLHPLIITGPDAGGYLMNEPEVKNYPGLHNVAGDQLMGAMIKHCEKVGCKMKYETLESVNFKVRPFELTTHANDKSSEKHIYTADVLIIAAGLHPRRLHCPGEETYWQHGVGVCALCEVCYDQEAVIIGNGHLALTNALHTARHTKKITLVFEENELNGPKDLRQTVLRLKPTILNNTKVTEIKGNGQHVTSVIIQNKLYPRGKEISANCVLISLGLKANTEIFNELKRDKNGFIIVDQNGHTSIPCVFAAGSITPLLFNQAITCAASGSLAALEAEKCLSQEDQKKSNPPSLYHALAFQNKLQKPQPLTSKKAV